MSEKTLFLNMFSAYEPPETLDSGLSQAAIVAADIDAPARRVDVVIHSDLYISRRVLEDVSRDICGLYGLNKLNITATHPVSQREHMDPEDLQWLFIQENSMAIGVLAGAKWSWDGDELVIGLRANGKKVLEESIPKVQMTLQEKFAAPVSIRIVAGAALEGQALFDAMEKMRGDMITDLPKVVQAKKKEQPAQNPEALYGKPFKGEATPMKDITLDMGNVIVEGKVFAVDHKE